ncbi:hypothetical protein HF520_04495 [Romboutsia sp. CE17]|uniref:pyridoxamine 5'-phosphate oxidase family protein n=1 Tax=Romboutsia sp. CE17 TaxID=2724150 RepID=UPI001442E273|nr:pyridoxamine 5'-phosphate oxidase family protein [Romboutsia sp. CE17]QJA08249.1 hypothetical protein HF520_04495 [Romboutsia sp. CE17]
MTLKDNLDICSINLIPYKELSLEEIYKVLDKSILCKLGLCIENTPYIVPMYFHYTTESDGIYFYMASEKRGKKIKSIYNNKNISIEIDNPVDYTCNANFESIIISGEIVSIKSVKPKNIYIQKIFSDNQILEKEYLENRNLDDLLLIKIKVNDISGRVTLY